MAGITKGMDIKSASLEIMKMECGFISNELKHATKAFSFIELFYLRTIWISNSVYDVMLSMA